MIEKNHEQQPQNHPETSHHQKEYDIPWFGSSAERSGVYTAEKRNGALRASSDPFESCDRSKVRTHSQRSAASDLSAGHSRKRKQRKRRKLLKNILGIISSVAAAVLIAFLINTFVFSFVNVVGGSMNDTLASGDKVVMERVSYYFSEPKRGDIIICHYPDSDAEFIKRIIGLPGETLEIRDGYVHINGEKLDEAEYLSASVFPLSDFAPITVPEGSYFVMGDNRHNSKDSRTSSVGCIVRSEILGKAVLRVWPFSEFGDI